MPALIRAVDIIPVLVSAQLWQLNTRFAIETKNKIPLSKGIKLILTPVASLLPAERSYDVKIESPLQIDISSTYK